MLYLVHFYWFKDKDISCVNVVEVDNQIKAKDIINEHYKNHTVNYIDETTYDYVKTYIDRGMPFVKL